MRSVPPHSDVSYIYIYTHKNEFIIEETIEFALSERRSMIRQISHQLEHRAGKVLFKLGLGLCGQTGPRDVRDAGRS